MRIWFSAASSATAVFSFAASGFCIKHLSHRSTIFWYFLISIVAAAFGFMLGVIPGVLLLGPLFHARGLANGAPFHEGDVIQIISGSHRGTVARIYSGWHGASVRVDLGAVAQQAYGDVFSPTEILRVTSTEPRIA